MKKLRVTVEGKVYEVLVEMLDEGTPAASPAAAPVAAAPILSAPVATAAAHRPVATMAAPAAGDVVSPLAGKVVSIDVKPGQTVTEGAQVATVEAMKMNTYIYAPKAGTVGAVLVNAGDAVEEGMPLLRIS